MFEILFRFFFLMVYFFVNLGNVLKYCSDFHKVYFLINRTVYLRDIHMGLLSFSIDVTNIVLYKVAFCLKSDAYTFFL